MFIKRVLFSLIAFLLSSNAHALTIGGDNYNKILSFSTSGDFGYWIKGPKYFTFKGNNDFLKAINIGKVNFADSSLAGINFQQVLAMGTMTSTNVANTPLATGSLNLYGKNDQVLLSATYIEDGFLTSIGTHGTAGQLDVKGVYKLTGGSLFTSGLIDGPLYIDISFNNVWLNNSRAGDIRTNQGTFTFYQLAGGGGSTDIPEPATVTLIATGIATMLRRRKRN